MTLAVLISSIGLLSLVNAPSCRGYEFHYQFLPHFNDFSLESSFIDSDVVIYSVKKMLAGVSGKLLPVTHFSANIRK